MILEDMEEIVTTIEINEETYEEIKTNKMACSNALWGVRGGKIVLYWLPLH